ncbi:MAG: hypothetical protein WCJ64_13175 [Rhodospirillaceae bacterium]
MTHLAPSSDLGGILGRGDGDCRSDHCSRWCTGGRVADLGESLEAPPDLPCWEPGTVDLAGEPLDGVDAYPGEGVDHQGPHRVEAPPPGTGPLESASEALGVQADHGPLGRLVWSRSV